ncbi:MAG: hypothetical protein ACXVGO_12470, partial [Mycobacterium sp.]
MKTFFSTTARVEGGQLDAALASSADAAKVVGRHGGDVRFFLAIAAGEQVESTLFSVEYDSPEAMGQAFDAMNTDPELHRIRTQANGSTQTSASMGMELPTSHTPTSGRGSIIELHASHVKPGRMAEFLDDSADVCAFVEGNGALNARVLQLTYAGMSSGLTTLIWEHENMAAHARASAAWFTDKGLALQAKGPGAADGPSVTVASM